MGGLLLGALALPAMACDLPKLPVIPATDQIGDQVPVVSAATSAYFEGMRAYVDCIEADLVAAGGDAAPASVKAVLVARNRAAVAEAQVIQKLFQERIGAGQTATPGSEEALRKYIEGIAGGAPDYDAMTEEWARTARQQLGFLRPSVANGGAIQSLEFVGIDNEGRNIYEVHQANGTINARISLDANGQIDFAMLRPTPTPGERRPTATIPRRR
ncbi:MAG TPA: hypothetical protein VLI71_03115 [Gammaproteobacteria bacterium]|nr:hypothetical protein [Gammaproteobacteria bacterium]